ncbi:hypothetical protein JW905_15340 [bacterium]|nr:hypothetical protein [candidate division CSSED10-310 bacterium]
MVAKKLSRHGSGNGEPVGWTKLGCMQRMADLLGMWSVSAQLLRDISQKAMANGQVPRAEALLWRSLETAAKTRDSMEELKAYGALEELFEVRGRWERLLFVLRRRAEILHKLGVDDGVANAYQKMAQTYLNLEDPEEALNCSSQALDVCGENSIELFCNLGIQHARILAGLGRVRKAEGVLATVVDSAIGASQRSLAAMVLHELGLLYLRNADFNQATDTLKRGLSMLEGTHSTMLEAIFLDDLGDSYLHGNEHQEAARSLRHAMTLWRRLDKCKEAVATARRLIEVLIVLQQPRSIAELLSELIRFCRGNNKQDELGDLIGIAKDLMMRNEKGLLLPSTFELMISEALNEEMPLHPILDRLELKGTGVILDGGVEEELPGGTVIELSEDYAESVLEELEQRKRKPN